MTTEKLPKRATVGDIARIIERSEKSVREYIHARGLKRGKDMKYTVAPIVEEHIERQKRDKRTRPENTTDDSGDLLPPATWSDKLKAKQVEKLEVQILELRGQLVPMDEVNATLAEHCAAVKAALDNWKQYIAAERRDAELTEWADDAVDRALRSIQTELD